MDPTPVLPYIHLFFGPEPEWKQVILFAFTPLFFVAFLIEFSLMRRRRKLHNFVGKDILANLGLGFTYQIWEVVIYALVNAALIHWIYQQRLWDFPVNAWTVLPLFFAVEFCYYWFHRCSHRVRWFWSAHVVHHSSEHMNMTTALRQSLLYSITGWWLFFMPLVLLGVHPGWVFALYALDLTYQYFVHTESVGKLPRWIEYVFNTPSNHRVHHGRNPQYIDRNFGGVFMLFDHWFDSYAEEQEAVDYGIPRQIHSHNILTINFYEFNDMWREVSKKGPLLERLKPLWKPPEYRRNPD